MKTSNSKRQRRLFSSFLLIVFCATCVAEAPIPYQGRLGYVVSNLSYALAPDAKESGACPAGMSMNSIDPFMKTPEGKRRADESEQDYGRRLKVVASRLGIAENGQDLCLHPEAGEPDPNFKVVTGSHIPVEGFNMDGEASANDFPGLEGGDGIDNQFYRVVGCTHAYQPTGQANSFNVAMLTGSWGILITLEGVDDLQNDDQVTVGFYANADPIYLSASREPIPHATYAMHQDPDFRAETQGRIKDGQLTAEPVDMRFEYDTSGMRSVRILRDVRLMATISTEGELSGYLGAFAPVEDLYDLSFGFRNAVELDGKLSKKRARVAAGKASSLGYTCAGVYHALHKYADGHPDASGRFTSISQQFKFDTTPAFVVDVETKSSNNSLISGEEKK